MHFYAGRMGSGKSLAMVFDTLPDLDEGRPVISTVRLLDFRNPRPCDDLACGCDKSDPARHRAAHPAYTKWTSWGQLLDLPRNGVAVADEITGVADSSEQSGIPSVITNQFAQLRRKDVVLRMTGLSYIRAAKRLREGTVAVTACRGDFAVDAFHDDGTPRLHRRRRRAEWVTKNAEQIPIEGPTEQHVEDAETLASCSIWIPDSPAVQAYDTFDVVDRVGTVTDAGRCAYCAGTRRAPECECPDYVHRKEARRPARRRASAEDGPPDLRPEPVAAIRLASTSHG